MSEQSRDVVIIGGGVMGGSVAYYLTAADPALKVTVVEKDPTYEFSSSTLSMANIRIQFSLKENIQISQYAFERLDSFGRDMTVDGEEPDIAFRREGNLFLYDSQGGAQGRTNMELQNSMGCGVEWWSPDKIVETFPLYQPEGYVGATYGPRDGHLDAYAVVMGYKAKARDQGAEFIKGEAVKIETQGKTASGVALTSGETIKAGAVVNCTGAWAAGIARTAGVELPVDPVKRQVFAIDTAVKPETALPLTFLPSGLYFRTETGGLILMGWSFDDDPVGIDFTWDRDRFMEIVWPALAEFVPAWDTAKLVRGWAGLYAVNTLDENAILGEWPDLSRLYLANGFSGHGLQQAPAVGRYISELILGHDHALDLSVFAPSRILEGKPIAESGIV